MKLTAFSVIRNANILGYPWLECYQAVMPYVDEFVLSEGYSEDDTWTWCQRFARKWPEVQLARHFWPCLQTGFAIGYATNGCMDVARERGGGWLLYVQADELWHPESLSGLRRLIEESPQADAFTFNYLHLEYNCQQLQGGGTLEKQDGAGYQRAIRLVKNEPYIRSHRDAWTFEGCAWVEHVMLSRPIVHNNYFLYHNVPLKRRRQAEEFYPDLGHYRYSAEVTEREWAEHKEVPEMFTRTTSPFQEYLNPIILPVLGMRRYEPALERT